MKIKDVLKSHPISIGDEVYVGRFKNPKAKVTGFGVDEYNCVKNKQRSQNYSNQE